MCKSCDQATQILGSLSSTNLDDIVARTDAYAKITNEARNEHPDIVGLAPFQR